MTMNETKLASKLAGTIAEAGMSSLIIPTGVPSLDEAIGIGGYPRGRVTELFGPKAGDAKMALAYGALREAQRVGCGCPAFIDVEHAFNPRMAQVRSVNLETIMLSQPESAEEAFHTAASIVRSGEVGLVLVSHIAAGLPGDGHGYDPAGYIPRMMSASLRKLTASCHKTGTAVVFVNHRESRVYTSTFGGDPPELLGTALKFYSSLRIDVRRVSEADAKPVFRAKVVKNKMAAPFRKAEWS